MSKAKSLLNIINENNLTHENRPIHESSSELDFVLEILEEFDISTDCLKSDFEPDTELVEFLENIDEEDINEELVMSILEVDMNQRYPYHDAEHSDRGDIYSPISKDRKSPQTDVSVLNLGKNKFYDKDNQYYVRLQKKAVNSRQPRKDYWRLIRALSNLVVNFSRKKPNLSRRARTFLNVVKTLAKPAKYWKDTWRPPNWKPFGRVPKKK